jgi:predicted nucleotidyltransferase/HEPN domain-containing protein
MKTGISHLPERKRNDLERAVDLIRESVPAEMIILFGSHARGDWVDDRYSEGHILYEYRSDYDILVVVERPEDAKESSANWSALEDRLHRAVRWADANVIVHDVGFVNDRLSERRYFFSDIKKEGVLLYDSGRFRLEEPGELGDAERKLIAEGDFEKWFKSADSFLIDFGNALDRDDYKIAAFYLHQATERFYTAFLLVHTGYKPKLHNIEKLGRLAAAHEPKLLRAFPRATPVEKERFKLLKRAYVDARYRDDYTITREDLEWLAGRVRELRSAIEASCRERIAGMGG